VNGGGARRTREAGKYAGQPYLKPRKLVENSYAVVAKRFAEDSAAAGRLFCSALLFVPAVDFALIDKKNCSQETYVSENGLH
jgi:hypothetical protein